MRQISNHSTTSLALRTGRNTMTSVAELRERMKTILCSMPSADNLLPDAQWTDFWNSPHYVVLMQMLQRHRHSLQVLGSLTMTQKANGKLVAMGLLPGKIALRDYMRVTSHRHLATVSPPTNQVTGDPFTVAPDSENFVSNVSWKQRWKCHSIDMTRW